MQKETSQLHHVNNHVIELEPIGLRHLEFHDRTLDFVDRMFISSNLILRENGTVLLAGNLILIPTIWSTQKFIIIIIIIIF